MSILLYPFVPRAMDVGRGDIVILMINLYPMNKGIHFVNSYLLGSDLSVAWRHALFELGPGWKSLSE